MRALISSVDARPLARCCGSGNNEFWRLRPAYLFSANTNRRARSGSPTKSNLRKFTESVSGEEGKAMGYPGGAVLKRKYAMVLLAALAVLLFGSMQARAQSSDNDACTNATLKGDYGFTVSGK